MAQSVYECMCILDSNKYAQNPNGVSAQIPDAITKHGGEVLVSRLYVEQKLAYPIGHHKKGTYWITYFKLEATSLINISADLRINENVIRFLTLKIPEKVAGPLIEHAKGGAKPRPVEAPVAATVKAGIVDDIDDTDDEESDE